MSDNWTAGDIYENYMGRWSRQLAALFLKWLDIPPKARWLDIGCGTGALTSAICSLAVPQSVLACDPSRSFVNHARSLLQDERVSFQVASVADLEEGAGAFDVVVSGLVLNFLPDPLDATSAIAKLTRTGGVVGAYVWDYAEGMQFLRTFWDAAAEIDPSAASLDEGVRFPICNADRLRVIFVEGGLQEVKTAPLQVPTVFRDFDDYWIPFTRGTGPAPSYVASLAPEKRETLRNLLSNRIASRVDGQIHLTAKAWAIKGITPPRASSAGA